MGFYGMRNKTPLSDNLLWHPFLVMLFRKPDTTKRPHAI
jgi:hypothetical protein